MAFYGCEFIFDGQSCKEYGLMLYDIGGNTQSEEVEFPSAGRLVEDRIAGRYSSLLYGLEQTDPLEFELVFGVNMASIDLNSPMDRYDVQRIASWLTGHKHWRYLQIVQPDMDQFRYKCVISELRLVTHGSMPWAFSCTVTCDSPYAYMLPERYKYDVNGSLTVTFKNRSSYNGYYKPKMRIQKTGGGDISIINITDFNREFKFTGLPTGSLDITIDNENQIILDNNTGLNLYPYFNYKFLRLLRGENILQITGDCEIELICEFPVNIGG